MAEAVNINAELAKGLNEIPEDAAVESSASAPAVQAAETPAEIPAQVAPQAETPPPPAWRTVATEMGIPIPDDAAEDQVFRNLFQGYAQGQQAYQQLQQITPQWSEFQKWQASEQARQQAEQAKAKEKPWWAEYHQVPEYDPAWENLVTRNEQGELVARPGAPFDILQKINAYENHRATVAKNLTTNPLEYLEKPTRHLAREEAKAVIAEVMREREEKSFVDRTLSSEEMKWLFNDKPNPFTGKKELSQWGQVYFEAARQLQPYGLPSNLEHQLALSSAQAQFSLANWDKRPSGGQPAVDPRQAANEKFHKQHERTPNMAAILPGPATGFTPPPTAKNMDIRDMLNKNLADYTDADVKEFLANPAKQINLVA